VTEPGVSVGVDTADDSDVPVVPDSAPDEYAGRDLDDALEQWLSQCYIDGWSYHGDIGALLENVIKDRRGRRGTAIIEHVYDDARERERLMKLRPIRVETVTAYTREGKRIVLRGDDDAGSFDTIAVSDYGDPVRDIAPKTPAGQTAAIAQFDDIFGSQEREEIPFAYGDISFSAYDSDTGVLFGRPDSATVLNRARSLRKKLRHVDQSVTNTAFGNIIAKVETQQQEVVKSVRDNLDVNIKDRGVRDQDPQTVSATNADVDLHEVDASVPDVTDIIQQEIEFILTSMPTPLYRVGFAGDINRDVTSEQGEDYRDAVKRERRRLEDDFRRMLRLKAKGLILGNPHTDESLDVDVALRIRPSTSESPLRDEEFDAGEFSNLMSGLSTAAGPKGGATAILPKEVIIDTVLDMDSEAVLDDGDTPPGDNAPAMPAQNSEVQAAFDDFTDGPDVEAETDAKLNWNPAEHPRNEDGEFTEVGEALTQVSELLTEVNNGETSDQVARRKMGDLVREETGIDSVRLLTLPNETKKAARASKEMIRLSETEDLSGLDEIRVSGTSDDLKGLRGVASGRYKIREKKIVINPDQFEQDVIDGWREEGHTIQTEPESIIRHEVGHYLHGEKVAPLNPDADVSWDEIDSDFDEQTADRIEEVLGEYAASMPGEFVAEAYTYQKEGGALPDDLQDLYSTWNGPEVN
jgi:hypothetical protein